MALIALGFRDTALSRFSYFIFSEICLLGLGTSFPSQFSVLELDLGDFLHVLFGQAHLSSHYDSEMYASSFDSS